MAKDTKSSKARKAVDDASSQSQTNPNENTGTPIETYKGDPDSQRAAEVGDIDEETLDPHAPFNKTYGAKRPAND